MENQPVALVTGTSKGIGRYLTEHLLVKGYRVVGCSRGPIDLVDENYTHLEADVTREQDVRSMVRQANRSFGRLDVLINNAGIASMNLVVTTPLSTVESILATNIMGTFLLCREASKLMIKRRYGRIINVGSVAVPLRLQGEAIYAASKSAVTVFTQTLAGEMAPYGITCNVVAPGPIKTDLIAGVPAETIQKLVDRLPLRRLGTCADVANVIDFFIKPESDYITGQVIYLGGV